MTILGTYIVFLIGRIVDIEERSSQCVFPTVPRSMKMSHRPQQFRKKNIFGSWSVCSGEAIALNHHDFAVELLS
jgi:hypothetical protein